jgi:uncharacterized protein involved in exopolysaccharide biosynthesis
MPDMYSLISRWWKQILMLVVLSLIVSSVIVFTKPQLYLSMATALPGNPLSADKSRVFSKNIEALYSDFGMPDDLDMIVGTAQLDTLYLAVTDQFNLYDHYKLGSDSKGRLNAARKLKKNSRIIKSDYGELKIKVWNKDPNLSPQLANALMETLQQHLMNLQSQHNRQVLEILRRSAADAQKRYDSLETLRSTSVIRLKILSDQLQEYEKLISEYELSLASNPQVLRITERARPAIYPDKPRKAEIITATGILSLLFGLLLALLLDRKKQKT